jgi:hypothetical protein
VDISTET